MDAARWRQVEELYHAALSRLPEERAAFLEEACPDPDLRHEIDSLIRFDAVKNPMLDQAAWERRLAAGERLGPYEILEQIGAGGMGEVWKALDSRLGRMVAIKVCTGRFSARFEREARAIAALNHPHICTLYDVGPNYLVMELVEGQPLRGPLPAEKAIAFARQILDALDAAHRQGIVHRDLKPANVLVTGSGVKLLDFGLAVIAQPDATHGAEAVTNRATGEQAVVGTPQYMAPEQIENKPVDARTDLFAFGALLYELLAGRRAFEGRTPSSTMAAVLAREPVAVSKQRSGIPEALDRIVQTCLAKEPEERFQTAREVKRALDWALESGPTVQPLRRVHWATGGALVGLAVGALSIGSWLATRQTESTVVRLSVDLGAEAVAGVGNVAAISPDGRRLVFPARGPDGNQQLATRLLDQPQTQLLAGTENGRNPFFSPDSQWIGYFAHGKIKKLSVHGGSPATLCDAYPAGGSWSDNNEIFTTLSAASPLFRVSASGGVPTIVTRTTNGEVTHRWPQVLPGGQAILFTASATRTGMDDAKIEVASLKTGATKVLQHGGYYARYAPSGHLVYVHRGTLFGVRFDANRLEIKGTPTPLFEDIASNVTFGLGQFDFSASPSGPGTLLYLPGKEPSKGWPVILMDSSGATQVLLSTPGRYSNPRFSPDGQRLALVVTSVKGSDILVYDLRRRAMTRLTYDGRAAAPVWSPDGRHLAFQSTSQGYGISWVRADGGGAAVKILGNEHNIYPASFSPDGRRLAYHLQYSEPRDDLWTLPLDLRDADHPKPGDPERFLSEPFDNQFPIFSPDGRWIAYRSFETGRPEIYVRPFPGPGGKWQISTNEGTGAYWSKNGRELFIKERGGRIGVVEYAAYANSFVAGKSRLWSDRLLQIVRSGAMEMNMNLAPDGKHFVGFPAEEEPATGRGSLHVTFVLNFFDELRRRVPAGSR